MAEKNELRKQIADFQKLVEHTRAQGQAILDYLGQGSETEKQLKYGEVVEEITELHEDIVDLLRMCVHFVMPFSVR